MKKLKTAALLLAAVMTFTGCQNSQSGNDGQSSESSAPISANETTGGNTNGHVEFTYSQLPMGGGGFVSGIILSPSDGAIYVRTDVGGAYRLNQDTGKWQCLSYNISEEDRGLLSIEGLAIAPSEPERVYMLAGCNYFSNGKTAVLVSKDSGTTFETVEVTDLIKVHGNGYGRENGERIAVDPKNADVVYCGGRTGGLIRSTDGGKTWARVAGFDKKATTNGNGVCAIVFDINDSNTIYVGVSEKSDENVYVTKDSGESWSNVSGLPSDLMPMRMKMDSAGNLLISYADNEGPGSASKGAIYRLSPDGTAEDISPEGNHPIGDVAVDANDPNKLVACTINTWVPQSNGSFGDIFFSSTDGGKTWKNLNDNMTMDSNGCEWVSPYAVHWCGSLILTGSKMMVCSGNGIFAVDNIWADTADFYFAAHGIEETVPLDIVTVKDGPVITAVGDYDGCVYDDVTQYGKLHTATNGSCSGFAVGGENNEIWAKVGTDDSKMTMLISTDAGESWITAKNPDTSGIAAGGKVAVSADGKTIFWSPANKYNTYFTTDLGETWTMCQGILGNLQICCDSVNSDYVYAAGNGEFRYSSDGGKTFEYSMSCIREQRMRVVQGEEKTVVMPFGSCLGISTDGGKSFTLIKKDENGNGIESCTAAGTGRGKNEGDPFVIYIWGKANGGDTGLYMSEDLGKTWVSISDEQHQFGGPGNGMFVTGDPNTYGRVYMSTVGLGVIVGNINS